MIDESIDKVNGRAKQAAGVRSGNKRLDNEGRADRANGLVKDAVDKVTSTLRR